MQIKENLTERDFMEMEALEKRYYSAEFIADYTEALDWYQHMPYTTMAVEDGGRIVAFLELFPVTKDVFEQLERGEFNDRYLEKTGIVDINGPISGTVDLFLSCVVVDQAYRKTDALKILLKAYAALYRRAVDCGVAINRVIIDNVTKEGERFSARYGFERLTDSDHGTVVYIQKFDHFLEVIDAL